MRESDREGRIMIKVIKKDGTKEEFNVQKVVVAVNKSAYRALVTFTEEELDFICNFVTEKVEQMRKKEVTISDMHNVVEGALEQTNPLVAKSYRDYRNYKQDFVQMLDEVYKKSQSIMYIGDKENSNTDSALVSTKRSLIFNELNKELYQKFFMTTEEIQACRDGYIYIHDMSARRDTMNCCLFNVQEVLKGGFEMGNLWYNEPKTLDVAFDVIGDIVLSAASQQYGGFTVPNIELILEPYAEKSYEAGIERYEGLGLSRERAEEEALKDVKREFEQGFQGLEYKFNSVSSKLVFLYDKNLHGPGCELEDVFEAGIRCSRQTMYPDWLSLTGEGYIASMYKKYGKIISPMGCRAFLSPWYKEGGMKPADEKDEPIFVGRFNIGAVSLHLPMIYAKSKQEGKDFHEVLDYYLNLIRELHIRTYEYLGEMKASTNPLAYCEGQDQAASEVCDGFLWNHSVE